MPRILSFVIFSLLSFSVNAQLNLAQGNPIVYGHHHVNASDVQAHMQFWIEGLGGSVKLVGSANREVIAFPNVLVFLTAKQPTGGTRGSVVNHIGFETADIYGAVAHLTSMGYVMITQSELPASYTVVDGIGKRDGGNTIAYVQGPDDIKVELIENKAISDSIVLHHIHWATADGEAMREWYSEHFLATPGSRIGQPAADLPGINLTFAPDSNELAPTRGRVLDHIGFEIEGLEAFCRGLEAKGIVLDMPYTEVPSLGIAVAFFTDPWGTYIELTEGLDQIK
ncbi:MAG: catechol 2,3-dioxygenase-like lactoylglutathione lyase family enzyme [Pseudohongiellaceae bacterium]|jgi:catechol 2,3-dioxygenase-like lactoylglutathione lyase family enzyme